MMLPQGNRNSKETSGENGAIKILRDKYNEAKKKADELSSIINDKDSKIPKKFSSKQGSKVYSAISTLLYASISISKVDEVEKLIMRKGTSLPIGVFDLQEWAPYLDMARRCRTISTTNEMLSDDILIPKITTPIITANSNNLNESLIHELKKIKKNINKSKKEVSTTRNSIINDLNHMNHIFKDVGKKLTDHINNADEMNNDKLDDDENFGNNGGDKSTAAEAAAAAPIINYDEIEHLSKELDKAKHILSSEKKKHDEEIKRLNNIYESTINKAQEDLVSVQQEAEIKTANAVATALAAVAPKPGTDEDQDLIESQIQSRINAVQAQSESIHLLEIKKWRDKADADTVVLETTKKEKDEALQQIVDLEQKLIEIEKNQYNTSMITSNANTNGNNTVNSEALQVANNDKEKLKKQINNLVDENLQLKEVTSDKDSKLETMTNKVNELENHLKQSIASVDLVQKEYMKYKEDMLKMATSSENEKIDTLNLEIEKYKEEKLRRNSDMQELSTKLEQSTVIVSSLESEKNSLNDRIISLESDKSSLQSQLELSTTAAAVAVAANENGSVDEAAAAQQALLKKLQDDLESTMKTRDVSDAKVNELEKSLIEMKTRLEKSDLQCKDLSKELKEKEQQSQESALTTVETNTSNNTALQVLQSKLDESLALQEQTSVECDSFKEKLSACQEQLQEVEMQLKEAGDAKLRAAQAATQQMNTLKNKINSLEKDKNKLQQNVNDSTSITTSSISSPIKSERMSQSLYNKRVVIVQSILRRFVARRRVQRLRYQAHARSQGVLVALPGTVQGKSGWYQADDSVYYFVRDRSEFVLMTGPLSLSEYQQSVGMLRQLLMEQVESQSQEVSLDGSNPNSQSGSNGNSGGTTNLAKKLLQMDGTNFEYATHLRLPKNIMLSRHVVVATRMQIDTLLLEVENKNSEIERMKHKMVHLKETTVSSMVPLHASSSFSDNNTAEMERIYDALTQTTNENSILRTQVNDLQIQIRAAEDYLFGAKESIHIALMAADAANLAAAAATASSDYRSATTSPRIDDISNTNNTALRLDFSTATGSLYKASLQSISTPRRMKRLVKLQALSRGFTTRSKLTKFKLIGTTSGLDDGVLVALPGSKQGEVGWYKAPNSLIYFFSMQQDEWLMIAGPLTMGDFLRMEVVGNACSVRGRANVLVRAPLLLSGLQNALGQDKLKWLQNKICVDNRDRSLCVALPIGDLIHSIKKDGI